MQTIKGYIQNIYTYLPDNAYSFHSIDWIFYFLVVQMTRQMFSTFNIGMAWWDVLMI